MEYSPLLLAHFNDRRADNHILYKRFDEAVNCHKNAAELLLQAMQLTSVTRALEALKLQYEYHKKQEDVIQVKKFQFEIHKKIVDYRNRKMTMQKKTSQKESKDQDLQWAIFRTMEEADSLLGMLLPKESGAGDELSTSPGQKRPKDDRTVIEELHTLNTQLRAFISQLLAQLEASERQVEALKARLRAYEDDSPPELPELAPLEMPQYDFTSSASHL
ncbi:nuclear receptor-binding factor 2-like [Macrosteles quadrilineatus]|uniref:nuclear receptor-binding factor 2-like n=1 Tax=Macrosteles quadrilineatus TaxID=74068 RepID=UPI0023E26A7D|nr:nuclear receptor-binding factor 2-like [Macrosteles quadrilineatus]